VRWAAGVLTWNDPAACWQTVEHLQRKLTGATSIVVLDNGSEPALVAPPEHFQGRGALMQMRLQDYARKLREGEPFAVSRWGDGEWACLLGDAGANCDGQRYSKRLRLELAAVLESRPRYYLGLQRLAVQLRGGEIRAWLGRRNLAPKWVDADVFARASRQGQLGPLLEALAGRRVVLVGPDYLAGLGLFPVAHWIPVPRRGCFEALAPLLEAVRAAIVVDSDRTVVLLSAGPAAKVLVHRVHAALPVVTLMDVGSLWEPYVGRTTRTYHRAVLAALRGRA